MSVRQYDYVLGRDKVAVHATKTTVAAPGGDIVIRIIVDDDAAGPGGTSAIANGLRMLENVIREQGFPAA